VPFVKLDCGILNSTLWFERECREVFLTALLMAEPFEVTHPMPQYAIHGFEETGFVVPPGWYGFVPAAGVGILDRAKVTADAGFAALEKLGSPEASSRSPEFEGRRLVRVDGGFIILNYIKYRERDYTSAERSKRYRERLAMKRAGASHRDNATTRRDITQEEAEVEVEAKAVQELSVVSDDFARFWDAFPKKRGKADTWKVWQKLKPSAEVVNQMLEALELQCRCRQWIEDDGKYIPWPAKWLRAACWQDELNREDFYRARL